MEARAIGIPALRVAILQNIVAPTRHALFSALAERVDLTVLFMARTEPTRGWTGTERPEYRHELLAGKSLTLPGSEPEALHLNPAVVPALRAGRYDVLLCAGYLSPTTWLALGTAKATHTRFLLWFGSSWARPGARAALAHPLKRVVVAGADGVIAYGSLSRERALALGADPSRTWVATNTTDVGAFAAAPREQQERPTALWVGRFVERKRADRAVSLFAEIAEGIPSLRVFFVGDGAERERTERLASAAGIDAEFLGERPYAEMPEHYARADLLVTLAEREPWGLVVNEALAAGVPVLASPGVAAAVELVPDGAGAVSGRQEELAAEARRLLSSPGSLAEARAAARSILPRLQPSVWADAVVDACDGAVAAYTRRA